MHSTEMRRQTGRSWPIVLAVLLLSLGLIFALYVFITLHYSYSSGERAGYVQKFSHKGWICKTWEGDLALVNLPGQPAELFSFTTRDEAVAAKINALIGHRVALIYDQHVGVPTNCFGETQYFVSDVKPVE